MMGETSYTKSWCKTGSYFSEDSLQLTCFMRQPQTTAASMPGAGRLARADPGTVAGGKIRYAYLDDAVVTLD